MITDSMFIKKEQFLAAVRKAAAGDRKLIGAVSVWADAENNCEVMLRESKDRYAMVIDQLKEVALPVKKKSGQKCSNCTWRMRPRLATWMLHSLDLVPTRLACDNCLSVILSEVASIDSEYVAKRTDYEASSRAVLIAFKDVLKELT